MSLTEEERNINERVIVLEASNKSLLSHISYLIEGTDSTYDYNVQLKQQLDKFINLEVAISSQHDLHRLLDLVTLSESFEKQEKDLRASCKLMASDLKNQIATFNDEEADEKDKSARVEEIHAAVRPLAWTN